MSRISRFTLAFVVFLPAMAPAASWFVSPSGTSLGDGSLARPWDLLTAMANPGAVRPGDTIYLRGGTYAAPSRGSIYCRLTGSSGQFITVRPYNAERVTVDGGFQMMTSWVIVRDLEVTSSFTKRITAFGGSFPSDILQPDGFNVQASNVKLINNVIHDGGVGIGSWKYAENAELYGNIIYYNGWKGPDRGHGHGFYMQNQKGRQTAMDNIVFSQFELGFQIYGSANTFLNGFNVEGNIVFNNGSMGGRMTRNILLGGDVVAKDAVIRSNYTYYPGAGALGGENNIGYWPFGKGCSNLVLEDNYFAAGGGTGLSMFNCTISSIRNNTVYGGVRPFTPSTYPGNTWLGQTRPAGVKVFVRPNRHEAGRAHVAVYNWDRASSVQADLSPIGLAAGDAYEVRDAQNFYGPAVATGVYTGAPVYIPMTSTAVAVPVGQVPYPPVHTDMEFGAFVVLKSGGAQPPPKALAISGAGIGSITRTSAVVSWSTNRPATSRAEYAASGGAMLVTGSTAMNTLHSATLTGLQSGVTYTVRISGADANGVTAQPQTLSFRTPPVILPLQITGSAASNVTSRGMTIAWTTNRPANTRVEYGTTSAFGSALPLDTALVTGHSASLAGLLPGTKYYFRLTSTDSTGQTAQNASLAATTLQLQTPAPPANVYSVWTEAENGARAGFPIVSDTTVSGRKYIYAAAADSGTVTYNVSVPVDGTYYMWFRALAPNTNTSSIYLRVDGGPEEIFDIAWGAWSGNWQWSAVNGRNGGLPLTVNPRAFALRKGWHKVYIRGRQAQTRLDGFVTSNDPSLRPTDAAFAVIR